MVFLILTIALIVIGLVAFVTWFLSMIAEGKCPLCAMKQITPTKLTIDTSKDEDYASKGRETPIMGWSSWNTMRNHIDEKTILEVSDALCETGLADAGYKFVNIDDCWQSSERDVDGKLQGDLESFPSGIKTLCETINEKGLKLGIYSSNGTLTCEDLPASLGNEKLDAKTFASWGVEFFKYDFCHHDYISGLTPAIEYVDINPIGQPVVATLTPDKAKYTGKAKTVEIKDLPTKKAMGMLNHGAGTAAFDVDIAENGDYVLTVHFNKTFAKKRKYMQIVINGEVTEIFFPAGQGWTPDGRVQAVAKMRQGNNHIVLQNPVVTRADSSYIQYRRMGKALSDATSEWAKFCGIPEKPITYSLCEWGTAKPWNWGVKAGNMWRTTHDIMANWLSVKTIYEFNVKLYDHASPGHINDPDMLEVGNGKLSPEENKSHFSLWCMMAAPLVLGNDLRVLTDGSKKSDIILSILKNEEMIKIDQDPLVKPAKRIGKNGSVDILARPLEDGDVALCFFNKGKSKKPVEFDINTLKDEKYLALERTSNPEVTDLWSDSCYHSDTIKASVASHGVKVYRISFKRIKPMPEPIDPAEMAVDDSPVDIEDIIRESESTETTDKKEN